VRWNKLLNFKKKSIFTRKTEEKPEEENLHGGVLAVWGSPGSGKTILAAKLAKYLAEKKKNTVLLLCDMTAPMLPCICPPSDLEYEKSLGSILAAAHISEALVKHNMVTHKKLPYLTILGMLKGENEYTYPPYTEVQARELIENLKAVDLFTEWVNEYIINETFLQYEKAVYDVFVKLNFKNKDLADLMEPEYIKFMLMQEKTKDFMKLFKAPSFRKTEFNLPKELNGLNKGKELSFRDHLEYNFFVYHSLTFSKDKSIFEFLQKRILGRNDIRKIVRDSVYLLLLRDEVNIREYEYELSWLVVLNLVVLAQNKEREFLLNDYKDVYGKIKSNNVNSDDKKFLKMLKEKKDEIASLKQSLSKAEEKATSDVTEYKRRAKEQEKIIYELNKKIRELESKNKEPEEAEELKAEIVIEKEAEREVTEEEFLDIINKYNICIYGGIPTWQAKVKKKYPQLHMIEAVGTPSLKPLDKACMIIYVNIWTSHCAWERVDNYASNLGLPKGHLNNYNIKFLWEVVVKEIEKLKLTKSS
jgi:archaellum biogenesis ATPase FlaH